MCFHWLLLSRILSSNEIVPAKLFERATVQNKKRQTGRDGLLLTCVFSITDLLMSLIG